MTLTTADSRQATARHEQSLVIDGLMISRWSRSVFEDMQRGGLSAVNCTCCVWEGFRGAIDNIVEWKKWFQENDDLIVQVFEPDDIIKAKASGRVGIILGWQNTSGIEDRVDLLRIFHELGVKVMQLTYNTQNLVGSGCWESRDSGLSDFGRDVVTEMNRLGILVDLSHVGPVTTADAIAFSKKPVAVTHGCPAALFAHPRNKTDEQMRALADAGGFMGLATFTPFLASGDKSTVDDCIVALEHMIHVMGEESVGIGTDFTQDQDAAFFSYLCKDKGVGRDTTGGKFPGVPPQPRGLERIGQFGNLTGAMMARGWRDDRIERVIGGNWLRFFREVW